jgi:2-polyprenyl-3-methyl-5-hydroxy-6-metoxy-1,4-benzoquinol methylase
MTSSSLETHDYEKYWKDLSRSSSYHPANRLRYHLIENALMRIVIDTKITVLDAGCGDGSLLKALAGHSKFASLVGIDVSEKRVEQNRLENSKIQFYQADLGVFGSLPKDLPGKFDIVISSEVIEHIADDAQFLKSLFALCKPGGRVILTTQSGPRFKMDVEVLGHLRHYKIDDLENLICAAGFQIERSLQTGFPWISLQKRLVDSMSGLVKKTLASGAEPSLGMKALLSTLSVLYRLNVKGYGPQLLVVAKKPLDH